MGLESKNACDMEMPKGLYIVCERKVGTNKQLLSVSQHIPRNGHQLQTLFRSPTPLIAPSPNASPNAFAYGNGCHILLVRAKKVCGGYRRGKERSHDVDVLVSFRRENGQSGHMNLVEVSR